MNVNFPQISIPSGCVRPLRGSLRLPRLSPGCPGAVPAGLLIRRPPHGAVPGAPVMAAAGAPVGTVPLWATGRAADAGPGKHLSGGGDAAGDGQRGGAAGALS